MQQHQELKKRNSSRALKMPLAHSRASKQQQLLDRQAPHQMLHRKQRQHPITFKDGPPTRQGVALYDLSDLGNCVKPEHVSKVRAAACRFRPTPAEEKFRGDQIRELHRRCERVCQVTFERHLPKDLLDQILFYNSCQRTWIRPQWEDPLMPVSAPRAQLMAIIRRELFGDIVGQVVAKDKQRVLSKIIALGEQTVAATQRWLERFVQWIPSPQGRAFVTKYEPNTMTCEEGADAADFLNESAAVSTAAPSLPTRWADDEVENDSNNDDGLGPISTSPNAGLVWGLDFLSAGWLRRLRHAENLICDYAALLSRSTEFTKGYENAVGHNIQRFAVEKIIICQTNVLIAMRPLVEPFIAQAAHQIYAAVEEYREAMRSCRAKLVPAMFGKDRESRSCDAKKETNAANNDKDDNVKDELLQSNSLKKQQSTKVSVRRLSSNSDPWDDEMTIEFDGDVLRCRRAHYEKYRSLFEICNRNWPVPFEEAVYCMLKRYDSAIYRPPHFCSGGNMHAAAPEHVFHCLKEELGVRAECFASPNNSFFREYFSAFPDVDFPFGSLGSVFDCEEYAEGALECGPPYTEEMLLHAANYVNRVLEKAGNEQRVLSICVFVPEWDDADGLRILRESPYLVKEVQGPGRRHTYVVGTQHVVANQQRYYVPPHATVCFVLQSPLAKATAALSAESADRLRCAMMDRREAPQQKEGGSNTRSVFTMDPHAFLNRATCIKHEDWFKFAALSLTDRRCIVNASEEDGHQSLSQKTERSTRRPHQEPRQDQRRAVRPKTAQREKDRHQDRPQNSSTEVGPNTTRNLTDRTDQHTDRHSRRQRPTPPPSEEAKELESTKAGLREPTLLERQAAGVMGVPVNEVWSQGGEHSYAGAAQQPVAAAVPSGGPTWVPVWNPAINRWVYAPAYQWQPQQALLPSYYCYQYPPC